MEKNNLKEKKSSIEMISAFSKFNIRDLRHVVRGLRIPVEKSDSKKILAKKLWCYSLFRQNLIELPENRELENLEAILKGKGLI